ncbi:MAG: ThiF family adenylyltransferase [Clostridia bacterium]|nr:ThiF family adenylyltransferase [Clostridia bacterium]
MMIDEEQQKNLLSSRIIVFGVGGVGSALVHMLARSGVQNIGIVDFDSIDTTNINRQMVAYHNNVGKLKVDELAMQLKQINPQINVKKYPIRFSVDTVSDIDWDYDYIVDCIDDLNAKKLLIQQANQLKIPIICAMGAGNRYQEIPHFEITDIKKTSYDPIAKIIRKFCAEQGINHLQVCYTKQNALKFDCKTIGSVVYYPINMASVMCAKVINDILNR